MAAILRHCLLTTGPTEDKTEELHRLVELQSQSILKGYLLFKKKITLTKVEIWETMKILILSKNIINLFDKSCLPEM